VALAVGVMVGCTVGVDVGNRVGGDVGNRVGVTEGDALGHSMQAHEAKVGSKYDSSIATCVSVGQKEVDVPSINSNQNISFGGRPE